MGGWTYRGKPKFKNWKDSRGRSSSGYHQKKKSGIDMKDRLVDMEEFMVRFSHDHGINYGTCNKFEVAKKIGVEFYREYCRLLAGPRRKPVQFKENH